MKFFSSGRSSVMAAVIAANALAISTPASALFIFTDVSHTANSITFTIDGDMSGYATPQATNQFSIRLLGDLFTGPESFTPNNWSGPVFDNKTFSFGNLYDDSNTTAYSWSAFEDLSNAYATMNTVTVSWSESWLNPLATNAIYEFIWGNGHDMSISTLLDRTGETSNLPEPLTLGLLGIGLAGLGFSRRQRRKNV